MKALFATSLNVIEAAVERTGFKCKLFHWSDIRSGHQDDPISLFISSTGVTAAVGTKNQIMCLIGALADDGQECLISAN